MPVSDWKVLGNRLLLRVIDPPEQDSSGLTLPESAVKSDAPQTTLGQIIALGEAVNPFEFEVGQHVIVLETWARVEIDGEEFIVCDAKEDGDVLLATHTDPSEPARRVAQYQADYTAAMLQEPAKRIG